MISSAMQRGAEKCGDLLEIRDLSETGDAADADISIMIGVKSRVKFWSLRAAGRTAVYMDKGYTRRATARSPLWRMSVNGHQPLEYVVMARHTAERWASLERRAASSWRVCGPHITVAGSDAKALDFRGDVENAETWAERVIEGIRQRTDAPIIYRPRSWRDAREIEGTTYSDYLDKEGLRKAMAQSRVVVTHASNACFDAALFGLPSIVLGEGIAAPISSRLLDDINNPFCVSMADRNQWLANVAWCQFTCNEFASGLGWRQLRTMLEAAA
jgi:hypothetical protein